MVRQKRRYLLVEILPSTSGSFRFTDTEIYHAILDQVARIHGDYGVGSIMTSFNVISVRSHVHKIRTKV